MVWLKRMAATRRLLIEVLFAVIDLATPAVLLFWPQSYIATATAVASVLVKVWGMPHQIYHIWKTGSAQDISIAKEWTNSFSYALWAVYGLKFHNPVVLWAQLPGFVGQYIIVRLVVHFKSTRLLPRLAENGHSIGRHCDVCDRVIKAANAKGQRVYSKWPHKCFGCGGNFHALRAFYYRYLTGPPEGPVNHLEAWCDGCGRTASFEVGPIERPEAWEGKFFYISSRYGEYRPVSMAAYLEHEHRWLASNQMTARRANFLRADVPSFDGFNDMDRTIKGSISGVPLDGYGYEPGQRPRIVPAVPINGAGRRDSALLAPDHPLRSAK